MQTNFFEWQNLNCQYLYAEIERLQNKLQSGQPLSYSDPKCADYAKTLEPDFPINRLCRTFNLSPFERDILLLCLSAEFKALATAANAPSQSPKLLSFALLLTQFQQVNWNVIAPTASLRRWQFIQVKPGTAWLTSPVQITESTFCYLMGCTDLNEHLARLVRPIKLSNLLVPSHQVIAQEIVSTWRQDPDRWTTALIQLYEGERSSQVAIASSVSQELGFKLYEMSSCDIPIHRADLEQFLHLWERESALNQSVLILHWQATSEPHGERETAIARLIKWLNSPLIILSSKRRAISERPCLSFEVSKLTLQEQVSLWQKELKQASAHLDDTEIPMLASQFNLSAGAIRSIATQALSEPIQPEHSLSTRLWNRCRTQARPQLDHLAQRIETQAIWDDLILPEQDLKQLQGITTHVRHRATVYESWGFAGKSRRGLGITALFQGKSGTGKTTAAEIIAKELQLDLYRIDLSQVVSKYIGETEKNLGAIFDAAELGGVVLLFDEADALFGKRSDVKDSHDRYANMEVSYLLQRMEAYQGLAILTTNLKETIDTAFLRRIRFIVKFAFPDVLQRKELWERMFPLQTPTQGLDVSKLARLNVAGGNIKNIALNAAFLAAEAAEPVQMKHVLEASKSEYAKLERTITEAEIKGWVSTRT